MLATIRNKSSAGVNIFVAGETPGPANLVISGDIITRAVVASPGSYVVFYAAGNGKVIASKTWYMNSSVPGCIPAVLFDDNLLEVLSVMTEIR